MAGKIYIQNPTAFFSAKDVSRTLLKKIIRMTKGKINSSKDPWDKAQIIADILGKLLIPIAIVILSIILPRYWSSHQDDLIRKERETNIELKTLEIFYRDITSKDPNQQKVALSMLKILKPDLAVKVMSALGYLTPEKGLELSGAIATDQSQREYIRSEAERVRFNLLAKFKITNPSYGDSVDLFDLIQGKTPFMGMNHYIVVTPLKTGGDFIQDVPAKVSSDGSWIGRAKLGTAEVGVGEKFAVRVIATKSTLSPGQLIPVPEDAFSSDSITVTRKK